MTEQEEAERRHCEAVATAHVHGGDVREQQRVFANIIERERADARRQALEEAAVEAERVRDAAHELAMEQKTKLRYLAHQGVSEGADAVVGCIRALASPKP